MGRTQPTTEQIEAFVGADHDGPVVMLNVLKFRDRAEGEDGSGAEAYGRYGEQVTKLVEEQGGRVLYVGPAFATLIGDDDDVYDAVALVEYPSRQAFLDMVSGERYADAHQHRAAGLAYQLLIATRPAGGALTG